MSAETDDGADRDGLAADVVDVEESAEEASRVRVEAPAPPAVGAGVLLPRNANGGLDRTAIQGQIREMASSACLEVAIPYLRSVIEQAQAAPHNYLLRRAAVNAAVSLARIGVSREEPAPDGTVETLRELRRMIEASRDLVAGRLQSPASIGTQPVAASNGSTTQQDTSEVHANSAEVVVTTAPKLTSHPAPDDDSPAVLARPRKRGRPAKGERPSRQSLSWLERKR